MIRLSEAMARVHCSDVVLTKHVQEAFRLLNKSIIRVETPEIDFETEESPPIPVEEEEDVVNGGPNGLADGDVNVQRTDEGDTGKPVKPVGRKIKVTYEQYRSIANVLILHLRKLEETTEEGKYLNADILVPKLLMERENQCMFLNGINFSICIHCSFDFILHL